MGINFPASPLVGDLWPNPAVGGQGQYTWDGEKWTGGTVNTVGAVRYDAVQTLSDDVGTTAGQKTQARKNIYAAPFDAMAYSGMQINGGMEVSQESGVAAVNLTTGVPKYLVDGWMGMYVNATAVFRGVQVGIGAQPIINGYFPNAVQLQANTPISSLASGDFATLIHQIEGYRCARLGWGTANAQPITLSFWVYAPVAGHFSVTIRNAPAYTRTYVVDLTVSAVNTWEYKTVNIPGDTTGTWNKDNNTGVHIAFVFAAGSGSVTAGGAWVAGNFNSTSAQTNFFATANNSVYVTGAVVLPGIEAPAAARSPLIMRPYDQELLMCKRYYNKLGNDKAISVIIQGAPGAGLFQSTTFPYPVEMRTTPTVTAAGFTQSNVQSVAFNASSTCLGVQICATAAGGMAWYNATTGVYLELAARL